jgi:site-specific DNA recombinase
VSTDEQAARGYSLPTQLEACRQYAEARGYCVLDEFTDDYTGTATTRPGLEQLYDAVRATGAGVVIVHDVDRLGRGTVPVAVIEHTLERLGARVEYVLGGAQYAGPEGELLKAIKTALSGYENHLRVERTVRGKRGKVRAGAVVTSKAPYGYRYVRDGRAGSGRLEPDPEEAPWVRAMYQWLLEGMTCYAIAEKLTALGVPSRGDRDPRVWKRRGRGWASQTVNKLLKSRVYLGEWQYGKTVRVLQGRTAQARQAPAAPEDRLIVPVPALVDAITWERAQQRLRENFALARRHRRHPYLLAGFLFCGACGRRYVGMGEAAPGCHYYRCALTTQPGRLPPDHPRLNLRAEYVEPTVWDYVIGELLGPDRLLAEVQRQQQAAARETEALATRLAGVEAALANVDRRLAALLTKELDGYPRAVIADHRQQLLAQRSALVAERDRLQAQAAAETITETTVQALRDLAETVAAAVPAMTFDERRELLRRLRLRVTVLDRDRVRVEGLITPAILTGLGANGVTTATEAVPQRQDPAPAQDLRPDGAAGENAIVSPLS